MPAMTEHTIRVPVADLDIIRVDCACGFSLQTKLAKLADLEAGNPGAPVSCPVCRSHWHIPLSSANLAAIFRLLDAARKATVDGKPLPISFVLPAPE